ncbi:organic cation transporter-like protein isoform X2 [Hyalella azteca]|uniref:Organic cation transporter-like protein isoform X2 n=1 Tax=Hyalella azteca TaxID=294128 RepID=A0A8B7P5U4_HYAAZ|nr:organic cation transporter-like protein isoform X2 [Hyalella azteca]
MHFEDLLAEAGGFGLYQKVLCFVLIPFTTGIVGLVYTCQLIILSVPRFRCDQNQSLETLISAEGSAVLDTDGLQGLDYEWDGSCEAGDSAPCRAWQYDYSNIFPTLASEENWVCSSAWKPYSVITAFWIGNMIGAWCLGIVSDKFGRRPVVLICCLVYGVTGIASAFVRNFFAFMTVRMLAGSVHHTLSHLPYVMVIEFCEMDKRSVPLLAIMMTYTVATIIAPVIAYFIWDWQLFVIFTAAPSLLIVLIYKWIPESATWLITQNKLKMAAQQLHSISKVNRINLSETYLKHRISQLSNKERHFINEDDIMLTTISREEDNEENVPHRDQVQPVVIVSVLKFPILRRQIGLVMVIWMVGCMCYYGHAQNTANLGDDMLVSFFLGAAVEIPAWSTPWLIERFGRRPPLILAYSLSAATGIMYSGLVVLTASWPARVLGMLGRLTVTAAYYIIYMALQYGPEVFPTVVRGQGVALAETLGGAAIFISPLVVYLVKFYRGLPLLVFGLLGAAAAILTIFLPETKNVALPSTLAGAEDAWRRGMRPRSQR